MKRFLFLLILSIACVANGISSNHGANKRHQNNSAITFYNKQDIGSGRIHKRIPQKPFCSAILTDKYLSFSFFAPIENAKIVITRDNIPVFSESYSKLEGSLEIQFSEELEEGDYVIAITNNDGLDLSGNLTI